MSNSEAANAGGNGDESKLGPSASKDDWQDLSNEAQQDILVGEVLGRTGGAGGRNPGTQSGSQSGAARTQAGAPVPDGSVRGQNADGFRQLMETGWTARFKGVEVEMRSLDEDTTSEIMDRAFDLFERAEESGAIAEDADGDGDGDGGIENPEEVAGAMDDDLIETLMGGDGEFDGWLVETLADVTEDETMDEAWWRDGTNYPGGAKIVLFVSLIERAASAYEAIESFR